MTLKQLPSIHHEPPDFLAYLEEFPDTTIVGRPKESGNCALSRWLSFVHRKPAAVTRELIIIDGVEYATPVWMAHYQVEADTRTKRKGSITAQKAITILRAVWPQETRVA
jgi:hypothetical protein